ncbi:MAG: M23 family metallopeptidase [Pseudomonadota bacterium]
MREGQYLLIPAAQPAPAVEEEQPVVSTTPLPGVGSNTPTPPSASKPLPEDDTATVQAAQPQEPVVELETTQASAARMILPAKGNIIREYAKGRNEGIDIKGAPGDPVIAADTGTVAAITESSDGVPILVLRHPDNLLTVYANVDKVSVRKGDSVDRGDTIAQLRGGDQSYVHFEVRDGFDSVDPMPYLR